MPITAQAQTPAGDTRPITLVVPIAAGGGVDAIGRLIAEKLQERLKQPVVVENRVGAGGAVGADSVAKAAPDGRTLLLIETSSILHKWLHKNVPFDVIADFAPVSRVAATSLLLFAHPSFPPNNPQEVIAHAKANPGKVSVGTPGVGTPHHLAMLMMNSAAKIDITHVPYRGTGPGAQRPAGRPDSNDLGHADRGHAARRDRQGEGARHRLGAARSFAAAGADHGGERAAGLPAADILRGRGAGQDAGRVRRTARPGDQGRDRHAGGAGADGEGRVRFRICSAATTFREQMAADHKRYGEIIRAAGIQPN